MTELRFAVCTFDRVFDTEPKQETLLLSQLVAALLRFELKPELLQRVQKSLRKLGQVWDSWEAGEYRSGKQYAALKKAADAARRDGHDPEPAVRLAYERLVTEAHGAPKRDLRLWSPAHYPPGAMRGGDEVIHLSCLVLDYDKGLPFVEAQAVWSDWFHIAHSTWSHSAAKNKYRIILPLVGPVKPEEWRGVWNWAEGLAGAWIDPAMKGRGVTFALPTSASAATEKIAVLHAEAPLLDPLALGLITQFAAPAPVVAEIERPSSHFNGGVRGHSYQELGPAEPVHEPPDILDISGEWDVAPPVAPPQSKPAPEPAPTALPAPAKPPADLDSDPDWDERSDEWESLFDDL